MLRQALKGLERWWHGLPPGLPVQALVLSGGGARAAYQAGVLRYIAEAFPETNFPILIGVSAGAINTSYLANHTGSLTEATSGLIKAWRDIDETRVFNPESSLSLLGRFIHRSGGADGKRQALLDPAPLRRFLSTRLEAEGGVLAGIQRNIEHGRLTACAVTATNYATGQTITWIEGADIEAWERPNRRSVPTRLTVDHIMASTALPILFPAVQIDGAWYGDGGVRLSAPLSPAIHLGANRILAVSTRYERSRAEADDPATFGYPPAAQIIGVLMNAIFLDVLDKDARNLERVNEIVRELPAHRRHGLRPIEFLVLRPSEDLGRRAANHPLNVSGALGVITRGFGTSETKSPDWLSMLLFEEEYIEHLLELGRKDAAQQHDRLAAFFSDEEQVYSVDELTNGV